MYIKKSDTNDNEKVTAEIKSTGLNLGKLVIKIVKSLNMYLKDCVGISTDGCSVMVSKIHGAVKTVMEAATNAVYTPCHNHILNLLICKSSNS